MNQLLENKQIYELSCGANLSYVLEEDSLFQLTAYKVLQRQTDGTFIRCMKTTYNGKVQLYYLLNQMKSLSAMLPGLDPDSFCVIVSNLFTGINETQSNGFLSCQNVELSFDKIYIDPNTLKVSLIYLPLKEHLFEDYASFENQLRSNLVKLISNNYTLYASRTARLERDLSNGTLSLGDICARLKGGSTSDRSASAPLVGNVSNSTGKLSKVPAQLKLVAVNAPTKVELVVQKDTYFLGRNPAATDGTITYNKMVGRVHCRIDRRGSQYTITDLNSVNGTFINRVRLVGDTPSVIKHGDTIRLANSDFQVVIS